jgi:uncharacterized protein (DUF924 family)
MSADWVARVIEFWFFELTPKAWFEKNQEVDRAIRDRFLPTYERVSRQSHSDELLADADTALAALVVLDQFPRNMFRGTPRSFEADPRALALAGHALSAGYDQAVDVSRRIFFYLPFEHSENLADQEKSVALFGRLGDANYLRYAHAHHEVIIRFGRFPHRNAILGRTSTPDEVAFLQTPGSSF